MWITWVCLLFWAVYIVKAIIRWATRDDRDSEAELLERDRRLGASLGRTTGSTPVVGKDVKRVEVCDHWTVMRTDGMDRLQEDRVEETTAESNDPKLTSDGVRVRINLLEYCVKIFDDQIKALENSKQEMQDNVALRLNRIEDRVDDFRDQLIKMENWKKEMQDNVLLRLNRIENRMHDSGDELTKTEQLKHETVTTECAKALNERTDLLRVDSGEINGERVFDDDPRASEKLPDAVSCDNNVVLPPVSDWLEVDKLGINNAGSMLQRAGLIKNSDECTNYLSEDFMPIVKTMITNIMCTKGLGPRPC